MGHTIWFFLFILWLLTSFFLSPPGDGRITLREYVGFFSMGLLPGLRGMPNLSNTAAILFDEGDMDGDRFLSRNDAEIIFHNLDKNGKKLDDNTSNRYMAVW